MAEIARHVIGLANRDPDRAQRAAEGFGYVLLGVEPENLCGVRPIDNAQLESGTAPYLGRDGPQMSADYVDLKGTNVLVISVRPPRPGDRTYSFEKEYQYDEPGGIHVHYRNGDIFVRRDGRTERANAQDLRMLERRLLAGAAPRPQLDVDLVLAKDQGLVTPIDLSNGAIERWLTRERQRLRRSDSTTTAGSPESRKAKRPRPVTLGELRKLYEGQIEPETRSPEEYDRSVEAYLAGVRPKLADYIRYRAVGRGLGRLRLAARNNTEDNYQEVAVILRFGGGVSAFFDADEANYELEPELPPAPRPWGPQRRAPLNLAALSGPRVGPLHHSPRPRRGRIDNSASAQIAFEPFHLRPRYRVRLPAVHLLVPASDVESTELIGHWYATSTSVSGSARGRLVVRLGESVPGETLLP
jgi:hypothetical protein